MQKVCIALVVAWLLLWPISPIFVSAQNGEATTPQPDTQRIAHDFVAQPGGNTITDTYRAYAPSSAGNIGEPLSLIYTLATDINYKIGSSDEAKMLYAIQDITSPTTPFYFKIDINDRWSNEFVRLNSNGTLTKLSAGIVNNADFPADRAAGNRRYLLSIINDPIIASVGVQIAGINTVVETTNTINCPDIQIQNATKKVAYEDLAAGETFYYDDQQNRFDAKRPPADAYLRLFWKPPGSPVYVAEPIQKVKIKEKNIGGQIIDYFEFNRNEKLRAGTYNFVTTWAIKSVNIEEADAKILQFDNMLVWGNFMTELMRFRTPKTFWDLVKATWGPMTINSLIMLEKNKRDLNYKVYGIDSTFEVREDGSMSTTECPDITVVRQKQLDYVDPGGDSKECGGIPPNAIFQWAFCQMSYAIRGFADFVVNKAMGYFTAVTNLGSGAATPNPVTTPPPSASP